MIPLPTFTIVGVVDGHIEFEAKEKKKNERMRYSTLKNNEGDFRLYKLKTLGGNFPLFLSEDLKNAMEDGKIYQIDGHLEFVRGSVALQAQSIKPSDDMQYVLQTPSWQAYGVISGVVHNKEAETANCVLGISGGQIRLFGAPMGKFPEEANGNFAKVTGVLATRYNARQDQDSVDTQFGNVEYIDPKELIQAGQKQQAENKKPEAKKSA